MKKAFLFPGQGSQYPNMLETLKKNSVSKNIINLANEYLGVDVIALTTKKALKETSAVQLSLLVSGVATFKLFEKENIQFDFVAGHSVGAFAAAVSSKVISFQDALQIVKLRGELMEQAHPKDYGMGVVIGLNENQLKKILTKEVYLANINSPTQITLSGDLRAIEETLELALTKGANVAQLLNVSTPSHSPLLNDVAKELKKALNTVKLNQPKIPYASNQGGRVLFDKESIKKDLEGSVASPVRWHDATSILYERGVRLFIEAEPGFVLTKLANQAFPKARAMSVSENGFENCLYLAQK